MKKHAMLFAAVLLTAAGLLTALLLGGCGRQKPADSTPTQTQNESASNTTDALAETGEATGQTTSAEDETTDETTGQTKPVSGGSQTGSQQSTKPQGSGVEDWSSDGTAATGSSQATESSQPKETVTQTTTSDPTQSTQPDKELTDLTFAQYSSLSGEDQEKFSQAFESEDAYLDWHKAAKAVYDQEQKEGVVSGSTNIDINDYLGK